MVGFLQHGKPFIESLQLCSWIWLITKKDYKFVINFSTSLLIFLTKFTIVFNLIMIYIHFITLDALIVLTVHIINKILLILKHPNIVSNAQFY